MKFIYRVKIGIDARMLGEEQTGIGLYIKKLIENIIKFDKEKVVKLPTYALLLALILLKILSDVIEEKHQITFKKQMLDLMRK